MKIILILIAALSITACEDKKTNESIDSSNNTTTRLTLSGSSFIAYDLVNEDHNNVFAYLKPSLDLEKNMLMVQGSMNDATFSINNSNSSSTMFMIDTNNISYTVQYDDDLITVTLVKQANLSAPNWSADHYERVITLSNKRCHLIMNANDYQETKSMQELNDRTIDNVYELNNQIIVSDLDLDLSKDGLLDAIKNNKDFFKNWTLQEQTKRKVDIFQNGQGEKVYDVIRRSCISNILETEHNNF